MIDDKESFQDVVRKLSIYISHAIDTPYTYEQLRTTVAGQSLKPLIFSLSEECHHPAIVAGLLYAVFRRYNALTDRSQSTAVGVDSAESRGCGT